jgi:uncharacterized integral membrane protein
LVCLGPLLPRIVGFLWRVVLGIDQGFVKTSQANSAWFTVIGIGGGILSVLILLWSVSTTTSMSVALTIESFGKAFGAK